MSKNTKVTGKMLKDLINEVMNEEKRLDEFKIDLGAGVDDWDTTNPKGFTSANKKKVSNKNISKSNLQSLAAAGGDPNQLDLTDIAAATGQAKTTAQTIANNPGTKVNQPDVQAALAGSPPPPPSPPGGSYTIGQIQAGDSKSKMKKAIFYFSSSIVSKNDNNYKEAERILTLLKNSYKNAAGKIYKDAKAQFDADVAQLIQGGQQGNLNNIQLEPIKKTMAASLGIEIDDIDLTQPFGSMSFTPSSTDVTGVDKKDTMSTAASQILSQIGDARFDASIVNQMALFDATTIDGKFQQLKDAHEQLKQISSGSLNLSTEDKLKLASKLNVLTYLTNISKIYDSSSAGFAFEKFVVAFCNGIGIGGINGAIDAALAGKGGTVIPSSQKLLSTGNVTQARGTATGQGLRGVLTKYGQIIYFVGDKIIESQNSSGTAAQNYDNFNVYILLLNKQREIYYLDPASQKFEKSSETFKLTGAKDIISMAKVRNFKAVAEIPILDSSTSDPTAIADSIAADLSGDSFFEPLLRIYKRLENMKRNTQSYQTTGGKSSQKSKTGKTAKDYVKQIGEDYVEVKNDYKDVFDTAAGSSSIRAGTGLAESRKITSNLLKKLISENFKK